MHGERNRLVKGGGGPNLGGHISTSRASVKAKPHADIEIGPSPQACVTLATSPSVQAICCI